MLSQRHKALKDVLYVIRCVRSPAAPVTRTVCPWGCKFTPALQ